MGEDTSVNVEIEEWTIAHPQWETLLDVVRQLEQAEWFDAADSVYIWRTSSHTLVALHAEEPVGFLRMVTQPVGADDDLPPMRYGEQILREAKILAFGVLPTHRRQGIGRALQAAAIQRARRLGCHQLKSHSAGSSQANHRLKLTMGFAMHRIVRGDDRYGAYFYMPLKSMPLQGKER